VVLTFFIASLGFGGFEVTLALFLKDSFGFNENDSFLIFAFIGLVLMLTQGLLYRRLASHVSEVTFIGLGIGFMALGVGIMGWITYSVSMREQSVDIPVRATTAVGLLAAPGSGPLLAISANQAPAPLDPVLVTLLFIALTSSVIGFAFLTPSAQALVSRRTPDDRQGEILGVNQSAAALARILGPVVGVTLYKSTDTHLLPYIVGAILLLVMLPMLPRIGRDDA
ncbi:MAG: MFS transporter, partial [Planctomycetes bacterium]|nr:MFS transporter [Planctomycetota bacterium]